MAYTDSATFLRIVRAEFELNRNMENALGMKSYMRNQFEYFGIKSELRNEIQRKILKAYGLPSQELLEQVVGELWTMPQREYQYFAMELLFRGCKKADPGIIRLVEEIILCKSWWDTVDFLAASVAGEIFKRHPDLIRPVTSRWMDSGNIWLQRSCLLFQLKYREKTDTTLLFRFINRLSGEKEFFIKKAIGWALREYSKTSPETVKQFVMSRKLQPLSVKEAMKYVK